MTQISWRVQRCVVFPFFLLLLFYCTQTTATTPTYVLYLYVKRSRLKEKEMGIADSRTPRKCVSRAREASRVARLLLTSMTTRTRSNNNNNKAIRTSKRVKENLKKAEKEEKIRAKEEAKAKAKGAILVSPSSSSTTIATIPCVTLNQIRKAQSKSNVSKLDQPVRISSKKVREEIYREAEEAIENKEIAALPSYGGRWWKCKVRITESKPPPLFR